MKSSVMLVLLVLSCSWLMGVPGEKYKLSANLGLINGASLGTGWMNKKKPNQETYMNIIYYTSSLLWYGGVNGEIRTYGKSNFYTLIAGGIDYGEIANYFGSPGGTDTDDSKAPTPFVYPHIVVGVGYRVNLGQDAHLFIEWDLGFKASITNINIGATF